VSAASDIHGRRQIATNADAREIGAAIRAERRLAGENADALLKQRREAQAARAAKKSKGRDESA